MNETNAQVFRKGMKDAIPIGLGYLAVAFSLGIAARNAGMNAFQGFLMSMLNNASAGEYAGITVIAANSPYVEMAIVTLITNARYLLMSCAMGQRLTPGLSFGHRLLMGFDITDELFGIAIARPGYLHPWYTYGAMTVAIPKQASPVTAQMQKVLDYTSAHGHITDEEVQSLLGIKKTRAFELMKQMRNMGLVQRVGRGAEKKYLLN